MKRIFLLFAGLAALLASCAKNEGTQTSSGDDMYVSFRVIPPVSGVVTYATVPDAVPQESQVNVLYVYVFGPNGGTSGTTDDYTLEGLYTYNQPGSDATAYTIDNIKVTGKNLKHVYFVANRRVATDIQVGVTKETALVDAGVGTVAMNSAQPFVSLAAQPYYPFPGLPMSAYTEVDFTSGTGVAAQPAGSPSLNVALLRAVARVDVQNATTNFSIESIAIKSRNNGYVFPSAFDAAGAFTGLLFSGMDAFVMPNATRENNLGYPGTMDTYGDVVFNPALAAPVDPGTAGWVRDDNPTEQFGAGYLYEASAADAASIIVKCRNTTNGELRVIEIPFAQTDGQGGPLANIAVQRNWVYTFKILETVYRGLEATFSVADWEDSPTVLTVPVPMTVSFTMTAPTLGNGETFTANGGGSYTLGSVPAAGDTYVVNINSQNVPIILDPDDLPASWVTASLSAQKGDGTYDLTVVVAPSAAPFALNTPIAIKADPAVIPTSSAVYLNIGQLKFI